MDFSSEEPGSSSRTFPHQRSHESTSSNERSSQQSGPGEFQIFNWYPFYQSCRRYFLDHAQHSQQVQTLAAFLNILLPYQRRLPLTSSKPSSPFSSGLSMGLGIPPMRSGAGPLPSMNAGTNAPAVSLITYIRRLVATGFDNAQILHGFFGDDWKEGVGPLHEVERRNYLFASKSTPWLQVKAQYDICPDETIPFLKPLQHVTELEISMADKQWSDWMAMGDWMLGPRAPDTMPPGSPRIKREPRD